MAISLPNTDPSTNYRFKDLGGGMVSEMMADQVQLFYNVNTGAARAFFNCLPFVQLGGVYHQLGNTYDILEVDFQHKMGRCYGAGLVDPVNPDVDLSRVSVAGVMLLIKAATDVEYNEREAAKAQAIADAEAQAAAAQAAADAADAAALAEGIDPATGEPVTAGT